MERGYREQGSQNVIDIVGHRRAKGFGGGGGDFPRKRKGAWAEE